MPASVLGVSYLFRLLLPGTAGGLVGESGPGRPFTGTVDADSAEERWWAVAWPEEWGWTGEAAFLVDRTGTVYGTDNEVPRYSGLDRVPDFEAVVRALGSPEGEASPWKGPAGETWSVR